MSSAIFETRFFIHFFASPDPNVHRKLLELMDRYQSRLVSAITIFEIYKLSLEKEGRETAETRVSRMTKEFRVVAVDTQVATSGAQLKHAAEVRYNENVPMADSLIAATSTINKAVCITDSPHFEKIPQVKCKWI